MALKGLEIFKLSPRTNCKECGCPTCMAFCMKVAQGALPIEKCPHMSDEAMEKLSAATAPPMATIQVGTGDNAYKLGGETVLFRHEKTLVSKNLFAISVCSCMENALVETKLADMAKVDYERISERMYVEFVHVKYGDNGAEKYVALVEQVMKSNRGMILECTDADVAKAALAICKDTKPILSGAHEGNWEAMNAVATEAGVVLGVCGGDLTAGCAVVDKLEAAGNKNLVIDVTAETAKATLANAVQLRRAALKDGNRSCGYPSIVNVSRLAKGDMFLQNALASMFVMKYGSIIVMDEMNYSEALPLYGLRQNIFTDPQKPMKVEPGIYPINGADENAPCLVTVDFALTYFLVSGELERSATPCNLLIVDAGGMSVLTAWAAGKLSSTTVKKFFEEFDIDNKIKSRKLILPGKIAVLKGEIEEKLPEWEIIVGTNEAVELVKYMRDGDFNK